jgi:hypothetical protein
MPIVAMLLWLFAARPFVNTFPVPPPPPPPKTTPLKHPPCPAHLVCRNGFEISTGKGHLTEYLVSGALVVREQFIADLAELPSGPDLQLTLARDDVALWKSLRGSFFRTGELRLREVLGEATVIFGTHQCATSPLVTHCIVRAKPRGGGGRVRRHSPAPLAVPVQAQSEVTPSEVHWRGAKAQSIDTQPEQSGCADWQQQPAAAAAASAPPPMYCQQTVAWPVVPVCRPLVDTGVWPPF